MSIYATINDAEPEFFSSTQGWRDVAAWAEELSADDYPEFIHLVEHGFTDDLSKVIPEIRSAMKASVPDASVSATIGELLDLMSGKSGEMIIDSGMSEDES